MIHNSKSKFTYFSQNVALYTTMKHIGDLAVGTTSNFISRPIEAKKTIPVAHYLQAKFTHFSTHGLIHFGDETLFGFETIAIRLAEKTYFKNLSFEKSKTII